MPIDYAYYSCIGFVHGLEGLLAYGQSDYREAFCRFDQPPATWDEALRQIVKHKCDEFYGFAFPGRHSGLFGTFYELLGMAGGDLFDTDLRPLFNSEAGERALGFLYRLHTIERVTPLDLTENWCYDKISERFRCGRCLQRWIGCCSRAWGQHSLSTNTKVMMSKP